MNTYSEHKKRIVIKPFPYVVHLIISTDVMQARQNYADKLGPYTGVRADAMHVCHEDAPVSYIFLTYWSDIECVVHEIYHCMWRLFDYIGAKHEEEVMAYHLGSLTGQVCSILGKFEQALDKMAKPG